MKKSFVRALSLVSLLAVPAGLIAQSAPTTTTTTTTMEKKAAPAPKKVKKHHKKMHHHVKSTAPAMSPTPASKK